MSKTTELYAVSYDGAISSEAYRTHEEAKRFILSRTNVDPDHNVGRTTVFTDVKGHTYRIHFLRFTNPKVS